MNSVEDSLICAIHDRPGVVGSRLGTVTSIDPVPMVDFPGNEHGPMSARLVASLTVDTISKAYAGRLPVLLVFENDDPSLPVIVDVVVANPLPAPSPERATISVQAKVARIVDVAADVVFVEPSWDERCRIEARTAIVLRNYEDPVIVLPCADGTSVIVGQLYPSIPAGQGHASDEIILKGTRVRIEADLELVLKSGGCVVHLDSRGKAVTTADQIVSRARGNNKVQGGSVQLN